MSKAILGYVVVHLTVADNAFDAKIGNVIDWLPVILAYDEHAYTATVTQVVADA